MECVESYCFVQMLEMDGALDTLRGCVVALQMVARSSSTSRVDLAMPIGQEHEAVSKGMTPEASGKADADGARA